MQMFNLFTKWSKEGIALSKETIVLRKEIDLKKVNDERESKFT